MRRSRAGYTSPSVPGPLGPRADGGRQAVLRDGRGHNGLGVLLENDLGGSTTGPGCDQLRGARRRCPCPPRPVPAAPMSPKSFRLPSGHRALRSRGGYVKPMPSGASSRMPSGLAQIWRRWRRRPARRTGAVGSGVVGSNAGAMRWLPVSFGCCVWTRRSSGRCWPARVRSTGSCLPRGRHGAMS